MDWLKNQLEETGSQIPESSSSKHFLLKRETARNRVSNTVSSLSFRMVTTNRVFQSNLQSSQGHSQIKSVMDRGTGLPGVRNQQLWCSGAGV
jgi:hypothetical protein